MNRQINSFNPRLAGGAPDLSPSGYAGIDAYVISQMRRLNLPGIALGIVSGDRIVHLRGFGRARPGGGAPSPQTPFFIGSLTKSFTALGVMQLAEAGKVGLDAPVERYLPWFRARLKGSGEPARLTVRQLLNQTGGLPLFPGWALTADFDDRPDAAERQARSLAPFTLARPPGAAFEYSNLNYNLLGLIIEAASGEPYPDYIQKHIFNPLQMRRSHTAKAAARRDGLATGHRTWFGFPVPAPDLPVPRGSLPSGQLISSAEDLCHYMIACLNGGRYGQARVLSPEGMEEMFRPAADTAVPGYDRTAYGMGWYIGEQGRLKVIHHSVLTPDFFASIVMLPDQKKGLVLLANADHFLMQPIMAEVEAGLARLLAGEPAGPIRWGPLAWLTRGLLVLPAMQIVEVAAALRGLRGGRAGRKSGWGRRVLLPAVPHLLASLTLIPALGPLRGFLQLFAPDFSWLARVCGGFGVVWMVLRAGLLLRAGRRGR